MLHDKGRGKAFAFSVCLQLREQTLIYIACAAADGLELHHDLAGSLDSFYRCAAHSCDLVELGGQTAIVIEVPDNENRRFLELFV